MNWLRYALAIVGVVSCATTAVPVDVELPPPYEEPEARILAKFRAFITPVFGGAMPLLGCSVDRDTMCCMYVNIPDECVHIYCRLYTQDDEWSLDEKTCNEYEQPKLDEL